MLAAFEKRLSYLLQLLKRTNQQGVISPRLLIYIYNTAPTALLFSLYISKSKNLLWSRSAVTPRYSSWSECNRHIPAPRTAAFVYGIVSHAKKETTICDRREKTRDSTEQTFGSQNDYRFLFFERPDRVNCEHLSRNGNGAPENQLPDSKTLFPLHSSN